MTDNVRQAVFQAGIKDAPIRDNLALHAGRLNSFDKLATEVSTVARTRNDNDIVPIDVSELKGKGGKSKDGKNTDGQEKAKVKDDKDKTNSKSISNKDQKCFDCDKISHVKADWRKKKRDDEERKTTLAQNSLTSSAATSPPRALLEASFRLSANSPSHVSDDEFHSPMRIFALKAGSPTDRVTVDSGAAHSACPYDYANEHEVRDVQQKNSIPDGQRRTPRAPW